MIMRIGIQIAVAVWLSLLLISGFWGQAVTVGIWSDIYFGLILANLILLGWTIKHLIPAFSGDLISAHAAKDIEATFASLSKVEYLYYFLLALDGLGNLYLDYGKSRSVTGIQSTYCVLWALADIGVVFMSVQQFIALTQGKILRVVDNVKRAA